MITDQSAYWDYENLLRQLHYMIADGKCDTPEADALRDRLDALARRIDATELSRLENLSGDLYMLQDEETYVPLETTEAQDYDLMLWEAWSTRDWDRVLDLLRRDVVFREEDRRAYLRSRSYEALGHADTALLFMDYAHKLKPQDGVYPYLSMQLLEDMGRGEEALLRAQQWLNRNPVPSSVVIKASSILFAATQHLNSEEALSVYERVRSPLAEALRDQSSLSRLPKEVISLGYVVLGYVDEQRGRWLSAQKAFTRVLTLNPHDIAIRRESVRLQREIDALLQRQEGDAVPTPPLDNDAVPSLLLNVRSLPATFDDLFLSSNLLTRSTSQLGVIDHTIVPA